MAKLILPDESYRIVGACFEVYNRMGCGFLEAVYQECLSIELAEQNIPFVQQAQIKLSYRGRTLLKDYVADFVCCGQILIEIKAAADLIDAHRAQLLNYLHASGLSLGLLINFGRAGGLQHERLLPRPIGA